jgi:hypothetical protein
MMRIGFSSKEKFTFYFYTPGLIFISQGQYQSTFVRKRSQRDIENSLGAVTSASCIWREHIKYAKGLLVMYFNAFSPTSAAQTQKNVAQYAEGKKVPLKMINISLKRAITRVQL